MRLRRPSKRLLAQLAANKHAEWRRKRVKMQDGRCHWCGARMKEPTLDHVIPLSKGGADHWENVVAAHEWCNKAKADLLPGEFARPGGWRATGDGSPKDERQKSPKTLSQSTQITR